MSDLNQSVSDLMQSMLSMANPTDAFSVRISDTIDRPENNLWVRCSDDPDLHSTIGNAIVHGKLICNHESGSHIEVHRDNYFKAYVLG